MITQLKGYWNLDVYLKTLFFNIYLIWLPPYFHYKKGTSAKIRSTASQPRAWALEKSLRRPSLFLYFAWISWIQANFKANVTKSVFIYSLLDRPSCSTPLKTQELPVLPHKIPPSSASSDGLSCAKFSYILPSIFSEKLHPELYITYLN